MPLEEAGAAPATALDVAVGFIMEFKRLLVTCWLVWPGDGAAPAAAAAWAGAAEASGLGGTYDAAAEGSAAVTAGVVGACDGAADGCWPAAIWACMLVIHWFGS